MKNTVLLILILIATCELTRAQRAILRDKQGIRTQTQISAISKAGVFANGRWYQFDQLDSVLVEKTDDQAEPPLASKLRVAGIRVGFTSFTSNLEIPDASMGSFYLSGGELYWKRKYTLPLKRDSILRLLQLSLNTKHEISKVSAVDKYTYIVDLQGLHLDTRAGNTGKRYGRIYKSGQWAILARISVEDGSYTIVCKDVYYGGISSGTYYLLGIIGFGRLREKAGDWQAEIIRDGGFREERRKEINLLDENLKRYFRVEAGRAF